jgi:8-amino-7-oxononanoate synthase
MDDEAAAWSDRGLKRSLRALERPEGAQVVHEGETLHNFGSNDYLGLACDPRVVEAGIAVARQYGWGATASPLVVGWHRPHQDLADALARFERAKAAIVFPSGYAALCGTVAALAGSGDAVYSDQLNHASLIDGARLSHSQVRVYPHADPAALAAMLEADRRRFRRRLIVTDGVFSMDGTLAPLGELADLADRFGAMLLVDEAHGTGVYGPDGRGACSACGVAERVPVRVGTLSKSLGSAGGFVAGSRRLIDWLINHARPFIFSTALPPAVAAAAGEALKILEAQPWRRERVVALGERLRVKLRASGRQIGRSGGPIIPVLIGDAAATLTLAERLRQRGFLAPAIRPPSVPEGTSRLRISVSAAHDAAAVDQLADAVSEEQP